MSMFYVVKVFRTIQGEGSRTGEPSVFVRLVGCNLWNGHEHARNRGSGVCANWCDTVFSHGTSYSLTELLDAIKEKAKGLKEPLIVITGGEPMLQLKKEHGFEFVSTLLETGFKVAIETNGTVSGEVIELLLKHPNGHVTVSPKPKKGKLDDSNHIKVRNGDDLKVIYPSEFSLSLIHI